MRFEPFSKLMSENTKNGIYKSKDFMGAGTPIVKMSQQFGNRFIDSYLDGYEQIILDDKELEGYRLLENDLLFSRTSVVPEGVGMCSIIREKERDLVFESNIIRVRLNNDLVNPEFVFRYFQSPQGRGSVLSIAGGTNIKTIKASSLKDLKIPLLDRDAQNNVVEMLRNYDDLIENNRRRIQLLEESARLLYQEWFVHLRFPGHEQVKITDGVPEGWEKKPISSFGRVITGKTPSTKNDAYYGDDVPFIKTPDMHGNVFVVSTSQSLSESGSKSQQSTLLPSRCIMVSCIGTVGVVSINPLKAHTNQQINSVIPENKYFVEFLFCGLKKIKPMLEAIGASSTMNNVNKSKFSSLELLMPSEKLITEFHFSVASTFDLILSLQNQNLALAKARDLLLPKLMSGELTV